jgi:septal ring factor EnvC (AmiA/AmiB activator)
MGKPRQQKSGAKKKRKVRRGNGKLVNADGKPITLQLVHADLQTLAQVCQQNFQQMSQNDTVLVDMATTNGIHCRAMMKAIEEHGIELQPFIDAELAQREKELEEMKKKEESVKKQIAEAMEKASASVVQPPEAQDGDHEPPPDPPEQNEDGPLIFSATPEETEETNAVGEDN